MAVTCPACGNANPQTNKFCENCGAALPEPVAAGVAQATSTAARAVSHPVATAPLVATVPPGATAPPVAPATPVVPAPTPTGPGLPLPLIAGAIAGAMILVGVLVLIVLALRGGGGGGGVDGDGGGGTAGGSTVDVQTLSVNVPDGWSVADKDTDLVILAGKNGAILFFSDKFQQAQTPEGLIQEHLTYRQKTDPDAKLCQPSKPRPVPNGPSDGIAGWICFTLTPSQGPAYPAIAEWIEGVGADGHTIYEVNVSTSAADFNSYVKEAIPIANTVHWKLPGS